MATALQCSTDEDFCWRQSSNEIFDKTNKHFHQKTHIKSTSVSRTGRWFWSSPAPARFFMLHLHLQSARLLQLDEYLNMWIYNFKCSCAHLFEYRTHISVNVCNTWREYRRGWSIGLKTAEMRRFSEESQDNPRPNTKTGSQAVMEEQITFMCVYVTYIYITLETQTRGVMSPNPYC